MVWTNLGKQRMFEEFFEGSSIGNTFCLQLASGTLLTGAWDAALSSTTQVVPISGTNLDGSGLVVNRNGVDLAVSSSVDLGLASAVRAVLQTANDAFQFSGPFEGAEYVLRSDDDNTNPEGTNKEIYASWSIGNVTNISDGNTLTINVLSLQGN